MFILVYKLQVWPLNVPATTISGRKTGLYTFSKLTYKQLSLTNKDHWLKNKVSS